MTTRCTRCAAPTTFACGARKPHCQDYDCRRFCNTCIPRGKKTEKPVNVARKLEIAIRNYDTRAISSALDKGADPHTTGSHFVTLLHIAAFQSDARLAKRLIDLKLNVSAQDFDGRTPLYLAAINGDEKVMQILLENGVAKNDINAALQAACSSGTKRKIALLIQNGADVNYCRWRDENSLRFAQYRRPLEILCIYGRGIDVLNTAIMMIDYGADVDACEKNDISLLAEVLSARKYEIAEFLISRGAKVSNLNGMKEMKSVWMGRILESMATFERPLLRTLLDHGLVVDQKIENENTNYKTFRRKYDAQKQILHLCLLRDARAPLLDPDFLPRDMFNLICRERLNLKEE